MLNGSRCSISVALIKNILSGGLSLEAFVCHHGVCLLSRSRCWSTMPILTTKEVELGA